jgi:hypothetical protein
MTIAICCPTNEGVVIGADSATTVTPSAPQGIELAVRHFNHAQKLFEVGRNSNYGPLMIATWGMGSIGGFSHRTLVAELDAMLAIPANTSKSVEEVANLWNDLIWDRFSNGLNAQIARVKILDLVRL